MSKNPLVNGIGASLYIVLVSLVMQWGTSMIPKNKPDTFMAPVVVISLFTLSAAVMGYLFGFAPIQLYFDGKKKQAVSLFLKTVGVFGAITVTLLALFFSGIIS